MYGRSDFIAALAARLAWWGRVGVGLKVLFPRRDDRSVHRRGYSISAATVFLRGVQFGLNCSALETQLPLFQVLAPSKQRSPRLREHLSGPAFGQRVRGIVSVTYAHSGSCRQWRVLIFRAFLSLRTGPTTTR